LYVHAQATGESGLHLQNVYIHLQPSFTEE